MSWFFGGGSDKDDKSSSSVSNSTEVFNEPTFGNSETQFASPNFSSSMPSGNIQERLQLEQQKALIQAVMLKLTDLSFDVCVPKPSSSLSSSETSCITATVCLFLFDCLFLMFRLESFWNHPSLF